MANEFVVKNGLISPNVQLQGSTSGSVTIAAPAVAGTTSITLPSTAGTLVTTGDTGTVTNTMLAGSIANAKLVNSAVTVGSTSISLGASSTTLAGLTSVTSTTFVGALTGNASTATTLQTARTIALSGDVAGSVSFDGSANATITTTIQPDSVALGTDTTGNYMVNVSAGTGVTVSHTPAEGSTATVSIGQAVGTTDNVTFNNVTVNGTLTSDDITSASISVAGNATITGNLTVSGTTTTINSTTIAIADLNLELARNATTATQANGAGITVTGPATAATLTYSSTDDRWNLNKNLNISRVYGTATNVSNVHTAGSYLTGGTFDGSAAVTWAVDATPSNTASKVVARDASGNFSASTITAALSGNASTASSWQNARTLSYTGDVTGSMSVDGSVNVSTALTLAASGVTAGTYNNVTVNSKGLVTSGSNVAYLTSYSETDTLATVTARGATTSSQITVDSVITTNNGNGTNIRLGDDVWIGDVNLANTFRIRGNQDAAQGYITFGSDNTQFGRNGTGALTWGGNTVWHAGNLTNLNQLTNGPGYITGYTETDTLATVTTRGASTSTASTFSGGLTTTGITVSKSGTDSTITFPAQTNDPGYIKHYESNNTAVMYFSVSDDAGANDYFSFGNTSSGYVEGFRITASGVVSVGTWQGSSISTSYTDAKITSISATSPIVASASTGAVTLSHADSGVTAGTYNNVTVNAKGHVTSGSNVSYLTSYSETDTLASVTGRGFTSRASSGTFATGTQGTPGLEIYGGGTTEPAYMTFHRPGVYAVRFGLDGSDLKVGGWSMGAVSYKMWHEGNLTNLNQLTNGPGYITGYTETDTLASVTARGSSTSTDISIGNAGTNTGLAIYHGAGAGDYGRIRFYQAGTNNQTIHVFPTTWQSGTLAAQSSGAINLSGANGVTFGAWNSVSGYIGNSGDLWTRSSIQAPVGIFTNDGSSRVLYLKGSGNIIQFQDADGTNRWENVGRNGTYYVYKGYGTGSGYKFQINDSGDITINNGSSTTISSSKLYLTIATPSGAQAVNSAASMVIDNTGNNFIQFRNSADNGTYQGLLFSDNNQGGYVVFANAGAGDLLRLGGYSSISFDVGTDDSTSSVAIKTQRGYIDSSANLFAFGSMRSPIFYDYNDTGYYCDPNSTTRLASLTVVNTISGNISGNADTVDNRHADYFYPASTDNGYSSGDINGNTTHQRLWAPDTVQDMFAFNPPTTVEYSTNGSSWTSTSISSDVFSGKMNGQWGGFNANVGDNIGAWRYVRLTWQSFGYRFFSHFTLAHSTNGHSFNLVFYKSSLDGTTWTEAFRQNGISSWPGYTVTKHSNVSGWWDTRDIRIVLELNYNSSYPNNAINIGHIGLHGSYGGFNRLFDWNGSKAITFNGNISAPILYDSNDTGYYVDPNSTSNLSNVVSPTYRVGGNSAWKIRGNGGNVQLAFEYDTSSTLSDSNIKAYLSGGTFVANGDIRAPVFYDSDNTGFYINAASSSNLNTAFANYFCGNSGNAYGIYKGYDNNNHFIAIRGSVSGNTTSPTITGAHHTTFVEYAEANDGTGWFFKTAATGNYDVVSRITRSYSYFEASVRSPLFYDSNDTGYYADPNSSSRLKHINVGNQGSLAGTTYAASLYHDTRYLMALRYSGGGSAYPWLVHDSSSFIIHFDSVGDRFSLDSSGNSQSTGSSRAPIFYDSNDTGYYADPNSTSQFNIVRMNNLEAGGLGRSSLNTIGGNIGNTVPQWNTAQLEVKNTDQGYVGIAFHRAGYSSVGLYSTGGNLQVTDSFYAPSFYDRDDSGYYVNPNGFSQLSYGNFNAAPSGRTLSLGGDQTDRVYNDSARASLVINASYYPHIYINATANASNTTHGPVLSMSGVLSAGGYRRWGMGIANTDPDCFSWGYYDNNTNPHYGVGGNFGYTGTNSKMWLNTGGSLMTTGDMRAPIFYDSNDTTYYLDPNTTGTSLKVAGNLELTARSASWAEGIMVRVPSSSSWGGIRFVRSVSPTTGNWAIGYTGLNSTDDLTFYGGTSNLIQLNLDQSGNLTARGNITAYGSPSDRRLKENIQPLTGALNKVMQLQGCTFDWKEDSIQHTMVGMREDIGFIADEVQNVVPEMVREGADGYLSLRDRGFSAILVEAIKEQQKQIEDQKSEISELKSLIDSLVDKLNKLVD